MQAEQVMELWREGEQRLANADPSLRPALERAVDAIVYELRRRLGGPFALAELADLYQQQGTDWCFDVAARAVPEEPSAWDIPTVAGAAFARYAHEASDYRVTTAARPPGMEPG